MMKHFDKEQKLVIRILSIIVLIICIISLILFFKKDSFTKKGDFVIPKKEENAIEGKPTNLPKECMYQEARVNNKYVIYLCAIPSLDNNQLTLYFTSSKENQGLIKVKILDLKGNTIGESGLINPNSYIKNIALNKDLNDKDRITVRVMNYERETYYSLGEIKLDLIIKKAN